MEEKARATSSFGPAAMAEETLTTATVMVTQTLPGHSLSAQPLKMDSFPGNEMVMDYGVIISAENTNRLSNKCVFGTFHKFNNFSNTK